MNYKNSLLLKKQIDSARNILLNFHRFPDPDSIGSALSLYNYLVSLKKTVSIICPTKIDSTLSFLKLPKNTFVEADFRNFDYSKYDLFIPLDSANWEIVTNQKDVIVPIKTFIIDHHFTNTKYSDHYIVDSDASSCAEVVFNIFNDLKFLPNSKISTLLLAGIIGDTGFFQFQNATAKTFQIASNLIAFGADKNLLALELVFSQSLENVYFVGEVIKKLKVDYKNRFAYSFIDYKTFNKYKGKEESKGYAADLILRAIKDTDFGIIVTEKTKGVFSVSLRSRNANFDVYKIALELGGGGHKASSGALIINSEQKIVFDKILKTCIKFAKKHEKENKQGKRNPKTN